MSIIPSTVPPRQPPAAPAPQARHDGLAVASLVLGLCGVLGLAPVLGAVLAVIFGHASRKAARGAHRPYSGLATAGLWLGYIGLALTLAGVILIAVLLAHHSAAAPVPGIQPTNIWDACHTSNPPPYC